MASDECERAIGDAIQFGCALLKYISPNNVGLTGGHEWGFYLPKAETVWPIFTPQPPLKGRNHTHSITILWQNGQLTDSTVKWYGRGTRSEYRITAFGRNFPFISPDVVGDLLVLIPEKRQERFRAYVLRTEDEIEEITTQLGANPARSWALYEGGVAPEQTEDEAIETGFKAFALGLKDFPAGRIFSSQTLHLLECIHSFRHLTPDAAILRSVELEFELFRRVERQLCSPVLEQQFRDVDDFIATAQTILQRRKSRAGKSLEYHVEYFLKAAEIPHKMQPGIAGEPDCVIPSEEAYLDRTYPEEKLFILGVKRTCRDRWRQVLNEAKRVRHKHVFTLQQGVSANQLREMGDSGVTLIVPKPFHTQFPSEERRRVVVTFADFIERVKRTLA